ncbi:MAG: CHASE2 domain-containing protein [Synechococcales bacterium]|nr:CHASE2 domain-containing protein [Synechococcales bacterium]
MTHVSAMNASLPTSFLLYVQLVEQTCSFQLLWGNGQQLRVMLSYPASLTRLYERWQEAYLNFYQQGFRAKVAHLGSGNLSTPDWRATLVQAEAALLSEFHFWLSSAELLPIRSQIAKAAVNATAIDVFLTCEPLDLARLPWEAWEIGTEFAAVSPIRITRSPTNIRSDITRLDSNPDLRSRRGKARILAILGDSTGLDFRHEQTILRALGRVAEVEWIGWNADQELPDLKEQICQKIADDRGWDILFFAGHSNEAILMGGELTIAPNQSIFLRELTPYLLTAKEKGLQFAIFNSCKGLNIAETLIDLGLSQVAVMREPIHNQVAQELFIKFMQHLANYEDVHTALRQACDALRLEKSLTFPSASLIPSLFRHPNSQPFQLESWSWRKHLQQLLPKTRLEKIALATCLSLSLWTPTQEFLMERRLWTQALYRDRTAQVPAQISPMGKPPVLLIHIDEKSLRRRGISTPNPIDRTYLADLLNKLTDAQAKVVGIDYILDRQQGKNDAILAKATRRAVQQNQTWLTFAAQRDSQELEEIGVGAETGIVSSQWSLQGYVNASLWYLELPDQHCSESCPFSYLLTLAHRLQQQSDTSIPRPTLPTSAAAIDRPPLRTQAWQAIAQVPTAAPFPSDFKRLRLSPITEFSFSLGQRWLQPPLDFSIPPERVFERMAAWELLEGQRSLDPELLRHQIVIIAAGGYGEAGMQPGSDNFPIPMAIAYGRAQTPAITYPRVFTGSEALAYMVHHFQTGHFIQVIPDLWLILLAGALIKIFLIFIPRFQKFKNLSPLTWCLIPLYCWISLQLFISLKILLPTILPSTLAIVYLLPDRWKKCLG